MKAKDDMTFRENAWFWIGRATAHRDAATGFEVLGWPSCAKVRRDLMRTASKQGAFYLNLSKLEMPK